MPKAMPQAMPKAMPKDLFRSVSLVRQLCSWNPCRSNAKHWEHRRGVSGVWCFSSPDLVFVCFDEPWSYGVRTLDAHLAETFLVTRAGSFCLAAL